MSHIKYRKTEMNFFVIRPSHHLFRFLLFIFYIDILYISFVIKSIYRLYKH